MVIGNGLLANTFIDFKDDENFLVLASGVSNSLETNYEEFIREKDLILSFSGSTACVIYFSTVGLYDTDLSSTPYNKHKAYIESLIIRNFNNYLIFRLPILVSNSNNPNTLTNFIHLKMSRNEEFPVFSRASRYLIDIDDVKTLVTGMIKSLYYKNEILDINFDNGIMINELVKIFENVINIIPKTVSIDRGSTYRTHNNAFINYLNKIEFQQTHDYLYLLIKKYYGKS